MNSDEIINLMISGSKHYLEYCKDPKRIRLQGKNYDVRFIEKNPQGYKLGDSDVFILTISGYNKNEALMDFSGDADDLPFLLVQNQPVTYTIDEIADALITDKDKIAINIRDNVENQLLSQYVNLRNGIDVVFVENMLWLIQKVVSAYQSITAPEYYTLPNVSSSLNSVMSLPNMTTEQTNAMNQSFASPLLYVWGAPGTGKTLHVLVPCIINYMLHGKQVLVLTPTNSTADNVAKATIEKIESIRNEPIFAELSTLAVRRAGRGVGADFRKKYPRNCEPKPSKTENRISALENLIKKVSSENTTYKEQIKSHKRHQTLWAKWFKKNLYKEIQDSIDNLNRKIDSNDRDIEKFYARISILKKSIELQPQANNVKPLVIVGTIDYGVTNINMYAQTAGHIFIDEVASIPLPKGMVLLNAHKPITVFGDHKQLPPIDNINITQIPPGHEDMCIWRLSMLYMVDIFRMGQTDVLNGCNHENLFDFTIPTTRLSKTFRYDKALTDILNQYVYHTELTSVNTNSTQLKYCTVPYFNNGEKRVNTAEIDMICRIIKNNNIIGDIGIISPYKNQVFALEKAIQQNTRHDGIFISTIHRAQGREYNTVILSISDKVNNAWFTDSTKTIGQLCINVAVSRAKLALIIVCDPSWEMAKGQLLSSIISIAKPL